MQALVSDRAQLLALEQKADAVVQQAGCDCDSVQRYLWRVRQENRRRTRELCDASLWFQPTLYAQQLVAWRREHELLLALAASGKLCAWLQTEATVSAVAAPG